MQANRHRRFLCIYHVRPIPIIAGATARLVTAFLLRFCKSHQNILSKPVASPSASNMARQGHLEIAVEKALRPHLLGFACRRRASTCSRSRSRPCDLRAALLCFIPVDPPREHGTSQPRLRSPLWSVLPGQNDPAALPACVSGRAAFLLVSGRPHVNSTHT